MSKKQTAVDWLVQQIKQPNFIHIPTSILFDQAKAMEKEQMIKAFNEGTFANDEKVTAEQYYNKIYGND